MQSGVGLRLGLWIVIAVLSALVILAARRFTRVPEGLRRVIKRAYPALDGFVRNIIGESGSRFTPIIGRVFVLVMALNLFGLVRGLISPAASVRMTAAFALAALVLVQYCEIQRIGLKSYMARVIGRPLWLFPIRVPVFVVCEAVRPVTLALCLFRNVLGEDVLAVMLVLMAVEVLWNTLMPVRLPMIFFEVLTSFVQAVVFSTLVAEYISAARGTRASRPVG